MDMKVGRMEIDELHNLHIMLLEGYIPLRTWFILLTKTVEDVVVQDVIQSKNILSTNINYTSTMVNFFKIKNFMSALIKRTL